MRAFYSTQKHFRVFILGAPEGWQVSIFDLENQRWVESEGCTRDTLKMAKATAEEKASALLGKKILAMKWRIASFGQSNARLPRCAWGVETAQVRLAQIHQDSLCAVSVAGIVPIIRFRDRVGKRVRTLRVQSRKHLLHFELRPLPSSDDRLGPFVDRISFLTPVLFGGVPHTPILQAERNQTSAPTASRVDSILPER